MPTMEKFMGRSILVCMLIFPLALSLALERPWICDTYFYWYTWDYDKKLGNWLGGVYNTPLSGYYDSRTYKDNKRSLWQAGEWGITHHFIDYWAPDWLGEGGVMREKIVFKAAEDLQKEGYDIWMSYYQDGWNFDTKHFSNNISQKRDTFLWLQLFSSSPVLVRLNGLPYKLIYSRNGFPQTTIDNEGFASYLRSIYPSIQTLNEEWGTNFSSFDEVKMNFNSPGHQRAYSIKYQYEIWRKEWEKLDKLVQQEFGLPGMRVSFDVGYEPFMGFNYSLFAKILGGPHSYAGIFGQPQEQDVERFIQSIVAKKYNTVFFDHFKNFYTDWEIRIPGTCYPPEPFHFDRFWCSALLRYSEALLHLSWNEWWEGSNLEPCWEHGKKYCEKNLFWATLMWEIFPQLRDFGKGAKVALLLNEWPLLSGEGNIKELYQTIQMLRQLNIPFDLIPDDLLSRETLSHFQLIIAPSCEVGFGYNQNGERVLDLLLDWLKQGENRKLIVSGNARLYQVLGLEETRKEGAIEPGKDLNVFVDFGEKGDEKFILKGASSQEDWGALPPEAYGKAERRLTVRWLPGAGTRTTLLLPLSPKRELVLRFRANALWDNQIAFLLNGKEAGKINILPGWNDYELRIPASLVNDYMGELTLDFQKANIPSQLDPQRFPAENRVCNIAIDWLQLSTPNFPPGKEENIYSLPQQSVVFQKNFLPLSFPLPYRKVPAIYPQRGIILSHYRLSNIPRDMIIPFSKGEVFYINGSLSDIEDKRYWGTILKWAGFPPPEYVSGENIIGNIYWVDNTAIVLAYNHNIKKEPILTIKVPAKNLPLAEAISLNSDGASFKKITYRKSGEFIETKTKLSYYASFAFVFSPIKLLNNSFTIVKGGKTALPLEIENLTDKPQQVIIRLRARFPTLISREIKLLLQPKARKIVRFPLLAKDTIDWGQKTIVVEFEGDWGRSIFPRPLIVMDLPNLVLTNKVVDCKNPKIIIRNEPNPFVQTSPARNLLIKLDDNLINAGDLEAGKELAISLPSLTLSPDYPDLVQKELTITYYSGGIKQEKKETIYYAVYPSSVSAFKGAIQSIFVFNPRSSVLENELLEIPWKGEKVSVRNERGLIVPSCIQNGKLYFAPTVAPKNSAVYYISHWEEPPTTDLSFKREKNLVKIENSYFSLVFDEDRGGSLISFLSKITNKDYGGGVSGASYGEFGRFDPLNPAISADKFIKDQIKYQSEGKGKIQVLASSPLYISLLISYEDDSIKARQYVDVYAFRDSFRIRSEVEPKKPYPEISPFALKLTTHSLSKIYPNFVGIETQDPSPHFGWREGPYVPPYITFMEPNRFPESISFILRDKKNLTHIRYGFFPPLRGKPGPRTYAWVEFLSKEPKPSYVDLLIKLHPGYHIVAEESYNDFQTPPYFVVSGKIHPERVEQSTVYSPPWLDTYRVNRIKFTILPREDLHDEVVSIRLPLEDDIVEDSFKAMEYGEDWELLGERLCIYDKGSGELRFLLSGRSEKGIPRQFLIYFAKGKEKPSQSPAFLLPAERLLNPSFEAEGEGWAFNNASLYSEEAHSGKYCALLSLSTGQGYSLLTNDSLKVIPHSRYRVSFYAKVLEGRGLLRTNFYQDQRYDFEQVVVPLINDGKWHKYEVEVPTGDFPPNVHPYFRLWAIGSPQVVLVDDVEVVPLERREKVDIIIGEKEELK